MENPIEPCRICGISIPFLSNGGLCKDCIALPHNEKVSLMATIGLTRSIDALAKSISQKSNHVGGDNKCHG